MKFIRLVLPLLVVFSLLVSGCSSSVTTIKQSALPTSAPTVSILPTSFSKVISGDQALKDDEKRMFNKMFYDAKEKGKFVIGTDEGEGLAFYQFETIADLGHDYFELIGQRYYGYRLIFLDYEKKYHKSFYSEEMFLPLNRYSKEARKIVSETFDPEKITLYVAKNKDGSYKIVSASEIKAPNTVSVEVVTKRPQSLQKENTIFLKGVYTGSEYVEFVIKGEIFDFKQIELTWDEQSNDIVEKRIVKTISSLNNQVVVIKTVEPEGIPIEKVTWKSKTGKKYEYIISYNDLEGSSKYFIIR